uniref:Cadherin n=1 Tax=Parastrongyloides trichosuri TaxID=131310 RepID=A0A0N5A3B0_PARTI
MSFNIPAILILYLSFGIIQSKNNLPCYFAESDNNEPFVVDFIVNKNLNEAVILNTVVDPPQADLTILNVRSNNLPKINFSSAFELRHHANGQFMIILKPNFTLPPYPAHINETNLTLTVMCNKYSHHLLTLKIRQPNMYPPMFYNSPYKLHISQMIENGSYLESQILAIDWDPQKKYPITYKIISGNDDDTFSLVVSNTTFYNRRVLPSKTPEGRKVPIRWSHSQLPPIVNILVNKPLTQRQYNLIIEASDNNTPPLNSTVNLTIYVEMKDEIVPVFSEKEYKANYSFNIKAGEELVTDKIIEAYYSSDIETNEIILYVMEESDVASLFSMDLMKGKIKVRKDLTPDIIGGTVKIELRAYSANNPHRYATATLILNEDTSNIAAHFSPCYQDVSIRENSKNGTILTKLNVVGSYSKILLLDSNGIFTVNQRNEIIVHDDTLLDREQIPFLEMKAQLLYDNKVETLKKSPCSVAFINVTIMDENDNSPLFLKSSYHFGFSKIPNNNTEIGIIKAIDNDEGINADLEYTINEEKEKNLPFTLVYKDNGVAIVFEKKEPFQKINDYYTFVVEVSDLTDNPRTSKISVAVDFNVDVIGMRQLRNNTKSDSNESREGTGIDEDGNLLPGVLTEEDIDDDPITMNKNDEKKYSRHFESEKYIFDVFGVVDDNQFVGAVKVIDAEPGEDITYELEVTTPNVFEINSGTGEIFTGPVLRSMDHDGVEFVFEVSARRKHVKVVSFM